MIPKVFSSNTTKYFYYITIGVAFFLIANTTFINGGYCSWSACYAEQFRNDAAIYDLFITSYNTAPVAPSVLLFPLLVKDNPKYQLLSFRGNYAFDYNDNKIYNENPTTKTIELSSVLPHERGLAWWFLIIKLLVLLSLPMWLLCAFIFRYIVAVIFKSYAQPILLVIAVLALLLSIQWRGLVYMFDNNYPSVTWPILLHQPCCTLRSPG